MRRTLALTFAFALTCADPSVSACAEPQVVPSGIYLNHMDRSTKPGDDFFAHANGAWLNTTEIPSDQASAGTIPEMRKKNEERLKAIIAELPANAKPGSEKRKLRDLYDAFLDEAQIEARGLDPVRADLDRIASAKTHVDVALLMGDTRLGLGGPFRITIAADGANPWYYIIYLNQSGLGLPGRDYYLKEDEFLAKTRDAYRSYLAQMLGFAGRDDAEAHAARIYDLEHAIAEIHWPAVDRTLETTHHPMSLYDLPRLAQGFPWNLYLRAMRIPLQSPVGELRINVGEKAAFPKLASLFAATPPSVWSDYLTVRYLAAFSAYLPKRIGDANFAMYGATIQGRSKQIDRAMRGVSLLDSRMGEALGRIYVQKHFPSSTKSKVKDLVKNLVRAHRENLMRMDLSPETRAKALEKIDMVTVKIGYPDTWRDYSGLTIDRANLVASIQNSNQFLWDRYLERLYKKVDRWEWSISPPTVSAYYSSSANEIVLGAGILQPPYFDPEADDAVNYGSIGSVIGHEIGHAFDDTGWKYDGRGTYKGWLTEADSLSFEARTSVLVEQYNAYEPLPGYKVNGRVTLGENIADLVGLIIARQAYHLSLKGKKAPVLDGYTGDQRLYLAYAQRERVKVTNAWMRYWVLSDTHSPGEYRVNGAVRNDDGWYEAFGVKPGDNLYLAPERRARLWGDVAQTAGADGSPAGGSP